MSDSEVVKWTFLQRYIIEHARNIKTEIPVDRYEKAIDALQILAQVIDRCLDAEGSFVTDQEVIRWMREAKAKAEEILK